MFGRNGYDRTSGEAREALVCYHEEDVQIEVRG